MNNPYTDIRGRISMPAKWFDENAVPRYDDFEPTECANIYAKEAALVRIACQSCAREFEVCFSHDHALDTILRKRPLISTSIVDGSLHYGDPPNVECCPAGPTMNSVPKRVLQYWKHSDSFVWERVQALEIEIEADWAEDEEA